MQLVTSLMILRERYFATPALGFANEDNLFKTFPLPIYTFHFFPYIKE